VDATHFRPGGNAGEPVPAVDGADIKSVWTIHQDLEAHHPGGVVGVDISILEKICSPGADICAVTYRLGMLELLEMCPGDLLAPWKRSGAFNEAVFRVAATIPMKWMEMGAPQSGFPFDVDTFLQELHKESTWLI
jgi:hypothetical protein